MEKKHQLFPEDFLKHDRCFGLFGLGDQGELDLPITIEGDAGILLHIVHSDHIHLGYLVGLIVLQAWTSGTGELGKPQVGNAVPSSLAHQVAGVVARILKSGADALSDSRISSEDQPAVRYG